MVLRKVLGRFGRPRATDQLRSGVVAAMAWVWIRLRRDCREIHVDDDCAPYRQRQKTCPHSAA